MRKLKLFSLALMALFSMSMWGADYTIYMATSSGVNTANVDKTEIKFTFNSMKAYSNSPVTTVADATYGIEAGLKAPRFGGSSDGNNIKIDVKSGYIATVTAYVQTNTADKAIAIKTTNAAPASTDLAYVNCAATNKVYKIEATNLAAGTYYIKVSADKIGLIKLVTTVGPACSDPNASIIDDAVGFVGDAIDLEYSSDNTSDIVWDIKKGGVATSDASISEGKFTATVAGTYVVTATQAKDGTHCEVEESVTLNISQKTPVTDFTIPASSSARKGDDVNLSITNLDAAATKIGWILAGDTVSKTADYVFTPNAAGSYVFTAYAANEFNTSGAIEKSCTITVNISDDATLSALSVAGKTLDPAFDAATFAYAVGEIGVYEKLTITYTANDAPYATAVLKNNIITDGADTVVVTAEDGTTVNNYIISYTRAAATELASISESTTWDWTNAGSATGEQTATTLPTNAEEFNFADVLISPANTFNAAALSGIAQFANRGTYFQGNKVKFNTTVAGTVVVTYSNTGGKRPYRHVKVNETMSAEGSASQDQKDTEAISVSAGNVEITFYIPDATDPQSRDGDVVGPAMGRIYKIVFTKTPATALDNTEAGVKAVKRLENGLLVIEKNGVRYNAMGQAIH